MVELDLTGQNEYSSSGMPEIVADALTHQVPEVVDPHLQLAPIKTNGNCGGRFESMGGNGVSEIFPRQRSIKGRILDSYEKAGHKMTDGSVQHQLRKLLNGQ